MAGSTPAGENFVHLHVHSEYSMLDGAARVKDLFAGCAEMGMPAIAVTDHGNTFAAYEFAKAGQATGVKPIIGMEAYVTPKTHRSERRRVRWGEDKAGASSSDDVSGGGAYTHMTVLSETTEGMHNLFRLSSLASLEGYFYKPRLDRELLSRYASGLIATTGCPGGEVQTYLRLGMFDDALASAAEFRDIFGAGSYYVELMDHGLAIENRTRADLLEIARRLKLPLVATNDLHYTHQSESAAHEVLLCVQSASTLADANRFKFEGDGYYLKSPAEMRALFADLPEACDNTLAIAERCEVTFTPGNGTYMPRFPCPPGENEESWFVKEVERGLRERYPDGVPEEARQRAEFETQVILPKGYAGYFLVVADFINWAKGQGIRVGPGRGSGAGSIAAYAMRITDLDPLVHGLLFERFLNPERVSMPDFDIDFDERRRGEVIRYVTEKYGSDRVAQIVTYGTIKAKQAVKDASRVLGYPFGVGEKITKAMPAPVMGKDVPLAKIFDPEDKRYGEGAEFRALYEADPDVKTVVDSAKDLEGLKRQWGVHAAGVIMSSEPLIDIIPIMRREQDGAIITQFDYPTCEALGLIKMDFLGLRNLTVLDDALENLRRNRGFDLVLEDLALDDPADVRAARPRRHARGLPARRWRRCAQLLRSMRPDASPTSRPCWRSTGPGRWGRTAHNKYARRKTGREPVTAIHPELAEPLADILDETYGLIVYQEQVLQIAQRVAGYSLGNADLLRKAMGKKKKEVLDAEFVPFSAGMAANGYTDVGDQGALGHPGPVLRLRVQQGAHRGVRAGVLLDRLPQGQLPGRVHGGAAHLGGRRQGQDRDLPRRVPPDGHLGAAAGRQRVRGQLHPRRHRHPLRPDRGAQRRAQRGRRHRRGARGTRQGGQLPRLPRPGAAGGLQQAGDRVAGQGRRVRLDGTHPPRADERLRQRGRWRARPEAQLGARPGRPVRRPGRDRSGADRQRARPARLGQADQARLRAGDARPLRQRPPAAGPRPRAGRRARRRDRRAAGRRRSP